MEPITFRLAQRRKFLRIGWICLAVFVLCVVVGVLIGGAAVILVIPGVVGLVLAAVTLTFAASRTDLTSAGIRTHRLIFSRHSCRWPDVAAVDVVKTSSSRGTRYSWIVVKRTSGKSFRLAAPYDASSDRDQQFSSKHGEIQHYWTQQRVQLLDRP